MKEKLTLPKALFWIFFSTLIISGTNFCIFSLIIKHQKNKFVSKKYQIKAIAQNQNEIILDANYLAELLDLSSNKPTNIFLFDEKIAKEKLERNPLVKNIEVKKFKPDCVYLNYTLRKPIAYLYDFENTAIDEEGYIFPVEPFYPQMDLCKLYLNIKFDGYKKLDSKKALYALDIFNKLKDSGFANLVKIKVLDTSRLEHKSYGQKELVLFIEEEIKVSRNQKDVVVIFPMILRLALNNYLEQIGNYISLRSRILKDYENQIKNVEFENEIVKFKPKTVDLRLSKLAFIDQ